MQVLVTGSSGLVGSEAVRAYARIGADVVGVDNNGRRDLFGPGGDTSANLAALQRDCPGLRHHDLDVRDREAVLALFAAERPEVVIHCAAQPSHDLARSRPFDDFDINAGGTLNLLEATRQHTPEAVFVFASTNKVYGDAPNELALVETETRFDYADPALHEGIDEACRIDRSLHSLFGASKAAADLYCQEYARTFGLKTGIFRAGCITGSAHAGVPLHGFLSYLVKTAARDETYTVIGHKGKQVRDQIHAADLVQAFMAFAAAPRPGEVYNIGGGRESNASILECLALLEARLGRPVRVEHEPTPRLGDHICYISDTRKLKAHYPGWRLERSLEGIVEELLAAEQARSA
jgi:CDP-paratose 2-epimerase